MQYILFKDSGDKDYFNINMQQARGSIFIIANDASAASFIGVIRRAGTAATVDKMGGNASTNIAATIAGNTITVSGVGNWFNALLLSTTVIS